MRRETRLISLFDSNIKRNENGKIMMPVLEHFISLNGEGLDSGKPVLFIRLVGCNLRCDFGDGGCDTCESLIFPKDRKEVDYKYCTAEEFAEIVRKKKLKRICLTGGEPLAREGIAEFIYDLATSFRMSDVRIEIETNGSISIKDTFSYIDVPNNVSFTLDYKPISSKMNVFMDLENWKRLDERDSIKFVIGSKEDMIQARKVIMEYKPKANIIFSPMYGKVDLEELWLFCHEDENIPLDIKLQLQIHKIFFPADKKGV